MKINLDLSQVSPGCRNDVVKAIMGTLRKNAVQIREDLTHYVEPEGQAYKDMDRWQKAADEDAFRVWGQAKPFVYGK